MMFLSCRTWFLTILLTPVGIFSRTCLPKLFVLGLNFFDDPRSERRVAFLDLIPTVDSTLAA